MRSHLTYSNVTATLALCLALGGGSAYAAVKLGKNSVGSRQIKNHSVALKDLTKSVTGGNGINGARGLQGPKGDVGPAGPAGAAGTPGKDLSFNGVRLGKAVARTADKGFQFTAEVVLGKAGSADIIGKCYLASDNKPHTYITLRRPTGTTGAMVVFGGTDVKGYATVAPGASYVLVDDTQNPQPESAYQWAATVADLSGGDTYDVRGFEYRTASQCILPEAQVEDVTRGA